jgi:DNA-binding response OmpR family regulator
MKMVSGSGAYGSQRSAVAIEDDADIRHLLVIVLEKRGFAVHEAITGFQGQQLVEAVGPDLITLDLNLPDMDGIDLCSDLRAVSDAHILTISARPPQLTTEQCLLAGSNHFIPKPFSPRLLGAYLDSVFPREGAA